MRIDNGNYNKDYGLLGKSLIKTALILLAMTYCMVALEWFSMKMESSRGVNSRMQNMAWNDFPLLSHPSPLPLISQSHEHHKEPMFLHILLSIPYTYVVIFERQNL